VVGTRASRTSAAGGGGTGAAGGAGGATLGVLVPHKQAMKHQL
jgi:hypothetical protein